MFPDIEAESKTLKDMSSHGSREFALENSTSWDQKLYTRIHQKIICR